MRSTTRCVSSSGTATPPTPSISSTSGAASIAAAQNEVRAAKSIFRPSRAAAMSGESGAAKRQGLSAAMLRSVTFLPMAASSFAVSHAPAVALS